MFISGVFFSGQSSMRAKHKMSATADSVESEQPFIFGFTNRGIS